MRLAKDLRVHPWCTLLWHTCTTSACKWHGHTTMKLVYKILLSVKLSLRNSALQPDTLAQCASSPG